MNASSAYSAMLGLNVPFIETRDAAALWRCSIDTANKTLKRLAEAGLIAPVRHGLWSTARKFDPHLLPDYLTAPYPSYLSLQTALYLRGMISQIPEVVFVVSLARTERIRTTAGTFSIHHVTPSLLGGFDVLDSGIHLATAEKALVDLLYLSTGRSRLFSRLPELELPRGFSRKTAYEWLARIPSARAQKIATDRFKRILAQLRE